MTEVSGAFSKQYDNQIELNLRRNSAREDTGRTIATTLAKTEAELVKLYSELGKKASDPEAAAKLEGRIKALELKLKRQVRVMEAFNNIMEMMHRTMMRAIDKLNVR